ncbi:methionine adenosyltransferase domain-containing protein [Candidatus Dojkabacteria bacterium]|jgi:S-adenosylmethionine synthetase|nr:methionine adenosyltransferase domain-containing protein [Candidatus Dojkabacteria bacterium]
MKNLKTAEYVTPHHPDKLCDRISDAILDACLEQDPMSRVAIETMGGHGIITITGELTTKAYINAREIAQRIAGTQYGVQINIVSQSPEIAQGVDTGGAGDQGIMVGYACNENEEMIPQELYLARSLGKYIYTEEPFDGKTQITLDGDQITTVVASFQNVSSTELENLVNEWLQLQGVNYGVKIYCNPAGDWKQGGFEADTGVTGRKLAVDNYGTRIPIGGGAFSGKDATKVDRSAAYMARKVAVDLLKEYNAREVIVKLAYAIGVAEPVMLTANVDGKNIELYGSKYTPRYIIETLNLRKPQFERLAREGHFGTNNIWDK